MAAQAQEERAVIPRPAASIEIDPDRLARLRERRAMSRLDLERAIDALHLSDPDVEGRRLRVTRDALTKLERGERRPKAKTLRALVLALSTRYEPLRPTDFFPGQGDLDEVMAARRAEGRKTYHQELIEFADLTGRPELYRDKAGKVRYTAELKRLFSDYQDYQAGLGLNGMEEPPLAS